MIDVALDTASVARIRLACSPVYETTAWLAWAASGRRHPLWGDPGAPARFALRDRAVAATAALLSGTVRAGYVPDFLTPKPDQSTPHGGGACSLARQLDRVAATSATTVRAQLLRLPARPDSWVQDPARLPGLVTSGLLRFWRIAMEETWPGVDRLLQQDQHQRLRQMSSGGIGSVLSSLHPQVRWTGSGLQIDKPSYEEQVALLDAELVLVPSLTGWPRLAVQVCDPADATLVYPAVVNAPTVPDGGTELLLGRGRSAVLAAVGSPASTSDLSRRLGLAPATVSHHLRILFSNGLVTRGRAGRSVLYHRTDSGEQLLATSPPRR